MAAAKVWGFFSMARTWWTAWVTGRGVDTVTVVSAGMAGPDTTGSVCVGKVKVGLGRAWLNTRGRGRAGSRTWTGRAGAGMRATGRGAGSGLGLSGVRGCGGG